VLVLDEPTASLDVSVRGQVLEILHQLQQQQQMAYLFISHDLDVVRRISDRVMVMYLGAIVESGRRRRSSLIRLIPIRGRCSRRHRRSTPGSAVSDSSRG